MRRGGGRKVRALPRKLVFLAFRRKAPGMSRNFARMCLTPFFQDDGKGGLSLRGVAVTTETAITHWEIKGRFRKRVVLAKVPSFRFSFRGNIRTYPSFRFSFRGNIRMYPRSGFRSGGTSAKTTLLETTLLSPSE